MTEVDTSRSSDDRLWAAACHLSALLWVALPLLPGPGLLGPLVLWLARRDESGFVEEQGRAALNFQITMAILALAAWPLVLLLIGYVLLWAIHLINVVMVLVATVSAASGRSWRYPFTMELVKPRTPPVA